MLLAFHKPFGVLSQFTPDHPGQRTLEEFGLPENVYPVGRLDKDSEGLLLLTDEKPLVDALLNPRRKLWKTYLAQVENLPSPQQLVRLREGVIFDGKRSLPARCLLLVEEPTLPPRVPPIRFRASIPTAWLEIQIHEGRNRQVRKMTAGVGLPTLRLFRKAIGNFQLPASLGPGKSLEVSPSQIFPPSQYS